MGEKEKNGIKGATAPSRFCPRHLGVRVASLPSRFGDKHFNVE